MNMLLITILLVVQPEVLDFQIEFLQLVDVARAKLKNVVDSNGNIKHNER